MYVHMLYILICITNRFYFLPQTGCDEWMETSSGEAHIPSMEPLVRVTCAG